MRSDAIKITIQGAPATKKNSARIMKDRRGRHFLAPSARYEEYAEDAIIQLRCYHHVPLEPIAKPVNLKCVYYMPTLRRVDLVNLLEATCDILVCARVLEDDDSGIIRSHDGSRVYLDRSNPRVEITIEPLEEVIPNDAR